jgi:hypothetical protein
MVELLHRMIIKLKTKVDLSGLLEVRRLLRQRNHYKITEKRVTLLLIYDHRRIPKIKNTLPLSPIKIKASIL